MKFKTVAGIIKLSPQRKTHIIQRHPIMEPYLKYLKEILVKPDEVRLSKYSSDVLLFYRYFDKIEDGKYIAVVVNKLDREVKTAYLTHRIKAGEKYKQSL